MKYDFFQQGLAKWMARRTGENDGEGAIGGDSAERRGEVGSGGGKC